jgi:hypothetical protein
MGVYKSQFLVDHGSVSSQCRYVNILCTFCTNPTEDLKLSHVKLRLRKIEAIGLKIFISERKILALVLLQVGYVLAVTYIAHIAEYLLHTGTKHGTKSLD